ncbi:MAG: hypothetical protein Q9226_007619 [Calogaya cf. arnoldii]
MVVRVPRGTQINKDSYGITHFLRIPYATRQSRPQLFESLTRIAQDPLAVQLPTEAWHHPEQLQLEVGLLRLDSPKREAEACQLLQEIGDQYRPLGLVPIPRLANSNNVTEESSQHLPPVVALHGLVEKPRPLYPKKALNLVCNVNEPQPFLIDFASRISDIFIARDFMPAIKHRPDSLRMPLMRTNRLKSDVRKFSIKPSPKRFGFYEIPSFDASDLHTEYKDYPWTTEFPLEMMCISEFHLRNVWKNGEFVRTAWKDIASVPLPGVSQDVVSAKDPDEYYINKWYSKKSQTSLRIPSTPPPTREDFEDAWLFYGENELYR